MRRDQKKYGMRLRRSGLKGDKTHEGFNFNPGINQQLITELARCGFVNEKVALLIAGPCGTGKGSLAHAIVHCAVREGIYVMFTTRSNQLSQIHAARATGSMEHKMQTTLHRYPSLVIDLLERIALFFNQFHQMTPTLRNSFHFNKFQVALVKLD